MKDGIPDFNPYLGPRPFERNGADRVRFFGRDREVEEIVSLIFGHPVVLVYAQSGAGKTSLFNAGITVNLEANGFDILPLTRVRGVAPSHADGAISNVYSLNALQNLEPDADPRTLAGLTLAAYLKQRPRPARSLRRSSPRVVVFDQFEELFTSFPERQHEQQVAFFHQVVQALTSDPLLRIVFVIREDYLAQLDPFAHLLPESLRIRFRLECLRAEAALLAIQSPLAATERRFAPGVAESLARELLRVRTVDVLGNIIEMEGQYAEPVQLQVVCMRLWRGLPPETTVIDHTHLQELGDVDEALAQFYEDSIHAVTSVTGIHEGDLRLWFEHHLITPTGMRSTVYRGAERTGDLANAAVDLLQNLHLIRGEWRAGSHWYELTHDRFVKPIQRSNEAWLGERREAEQARRRLEARAGEWVRLGRGEGGLLDEVELREAERWLAVSSEAHLALSGQVLQLVEVSRSVIEAEARAEEEARQRELTQARALADAEYRRAETQASAARSLRRLSAVMGVVILAALALAVYAWVQQRIADENARFAIMKENEAIDARTLAEQQKEKANQNAAKAIEAEEQTRLQQGQTNVLRLSTAAINTLETDPQLSLLLALEAVNYATFTSSRPQPEVEDALRQAVESSRVLLSLNGHDDSVDSVAYSGDGMLLATADASGTAWIWDAVTGEKVYGPFVHTGSIFDLDFSQDGAHLITVSGDNGVATLWDVASGEATPLNETSTAAAFSPDGTRLATARSTGSLSLWDAGSGKHLVSWDVEEEYTWQLAFSPDGKRLATAGGDGVARVWDVESQENLLSLLGDTNWLQTVAFDATGARLATGGGDKIIKVWDLATEEELNAFIGHTNTVSDLAFSPNENHLISASRDGSAKVWDLTTGKELYTLSGHTDGLLSVAFSPDGVTAATASLDHTVKLWNVAENSGSLTIAGHLEKIHDAVFSPDGKRVASASSDLTAKVWDAETGEMLLTLGHNRWVNCIAYSLDGQHLATGDGDGSVTVWDAETGQILHVLNGHIGEVFSVAFSPNGKQLASTGADHAVKLWDVATGEVTTLNGHNGPVYDAVFSPAGDRLATTSYDGSVRIWDLVNGQEAWQYPVKGSWFIALAYDSRSTRFSAASRDNRVLVWETDKVTENAETALVGYKGAVVDVEFSPVQPHIATASDDGTVRVWDVETGKELFVFTRYANSPSAVAFSPDGMNLLVIWGDSLLHIYSLDFAELMAQARRRLARSFTAQECITYLEPLEPGICKVVVQSFATLVRGRQAALAGDFTNAIADFRHVQVDMPYLAFDPEREAYHIARDAQLNEGWKLAYTGNITGAVQSFQGLQSPASDGAIDLTASQRRYAAALSRIGWRLSQQGRTADSIKLIKNAVALDPANKWLHYVAGTTYLGLADYPNAIKALQQAVEGDATFLLSQVYLGEAYRLNRQYDNAIDAFERAIELFGEDATVRSWLGTAYLSTSLEGAYNAFSQSIGIAETPGASYGLGLVYQAQGDYRLATEALKKAIEQDPNLFDAYVALAEVYRKTEDYDSAVTLLEDAVNRDPTNIMVLATLKRVYDFMLGPQDNRQKYDRVVKLLNERIVRMPKDFFSQLRLGFVYYEYLFDYSAAYETFTSLHLANRDNLDVRQGLAVASLGNGQLDEAYMLAEAILRENETTQMLQEGEKLNLRAVLICVSILQGEDEQAQQHIDQFLLEYEQLPSDSPIFLTYVGSRNLLQQAGLDSAAVDMIVALFELIEAPPQKQELVEFERLRSEWAR